ncbi:hypothetical protein OPV22_020252 [Ensete ventricosum]|uniref:Uncharacterized protein n=1 Tax=Ensete ventricosum TaxID=4639 RepID=A0AAV8PA07_ENSVE|nr:hypothetical protein OPV22_020252 [Ensete ventricosum]
MIEHGAPANGQICGDSEFYREGVKGTVTNGLVGIQDITVELARVDSYLSAHDVCRSLQVDNRKIYPVQSGAIEFASQSPWPYIHSRLSTIPGGPTETRVVVDRIDPIKEPVDFETVRGQGKPWAVFRGGSG